MEIQKQKNGEPINFNQFSDRVTQAFQSSNILNDFKIILECKISFKNKTHNI